MIWTLEIAVLVILVLQDVLGLRNVHVEIPNAVIRGSSVLFNCLYDLEDDQLYAIKWYQGMEEFYRYIPKEIPPIKVFQRKGIHVDISSSDSTKVRLKNVQPEISGRFRCEVSADGTFETLYSDSFITVVDLPSNPRVMSDKSLYEDFDDIQANCTSLGSYPPVNITWLINNKEISPYHSRYTVLPGENDYKRNVVSHLELGMDQIESNHVTLTCVASLFDLYRKTSDLSIRRKQSVILKMASIITSDNAYGRSSSQLEGYQIRITMLMLFVKFLSICELR